MAVARIVGFETGDFAQCTTSSGTVSIDPTTKRTGGYALKSSPTTTATGYARIPTPTGAVAIRFYFYAASLPSNTEMICHFFATDTSNPHLRLTSGGSLQMYIGALGGNVGTAATVSAGTWYRIDYWSSASGQAWSIDGAEKYANAADASASVNCYLGKVANISGASVEFYYDDVVINDSAAAYPIGAGQSIARQPAAGLGTPTYNDWTKSTGTDAGALWDNTPYTNTDYCSTATNPKYQTSFVSDFSTGTNAIGASDTINGCLVGLVAKTSATSASGTNCYIRRRVNSADTDTLLSLTTSEVYYQESTAWTDTRTNLDGMEAGATTTAATRTRTVYDVWVFVDYTPAAASTPSLVYNPRRHALPSAILTR